MIHTDWSEDKSCMTAIDAEVAVGGPELSGIAGWRGDECGHWEGSHAVFSEIWERNTIVSIFSHMYVMHVYQEQCALLCRRKHV